VSSDFKELNIAKNRLEEIIRKFWESNNCQQGKYSTVQPARHRAEYIQDGCQVTVDFHFINNGTTTIQSKIGKNHDKGEQLAIYLKDELVNDNRKSISVSTKNIEENNFDLLLEFLQEIKNEVSGETTISVSKNPENKVSRSVKAISQYKDSLTLTHYTTTNTLLIQGKPLYVYNQVCYFLADFTDLNGFLDIIYKGETVPNTIEIDRDNIENTLKNLLPIAYSNLGDGILGMIRTSYTLKDISIPLDDYSYCAFPSLRSLEGVMRRLLSDKEYYVEDHKNSFGEVFYKDLNARKYFVRDDLKHQLGNKTCEALECCYGYFVEQRHELFHTSDFTDASRIIPTQEQASQIIEKVVRIIESAYSKLL
jgi:RNase LS, bacterial toxin DBD domain/RNase LS, bacterial toxin N-terminal/RNase LS, bacterial toxin